MNRRLTPEERRKGRLTLFVELLLVILPLAIMIVVALAKNDFKSVLSSPEWSLAATIVSGQATLRFYSGLIKQEGIKNPQVILLWSTLMIALTILSAVIYGLKLGYSDSFFLSFLQIPLFLISALIFVIFGGIGQAYLDRK